MLVVFWVYSDAGEMKIWVAFELVVDFTEFLSVAYGAFWADGKELGNDPDLAAQVR